MKRLTAAVLTLAFVRTIGSVTALAQEAGDSPAAASLRGGNVWHFLGAAIGLGMVVIGAAIGIGKLAAAAAEGVHPGARHVSRWREEYLRDFAARLLRCTNPAGAKVGGSQ